MSDALTRAMEFLDAAVADDLGGHTYSASTAPELVGLMGYAQSGKDATAQVLIEHYGFTRIAFADALRDMLYALNPLVYGPGAGRTHCDIPWLWSVQEIVDAHGWEFAKAHSEVRDYLQRLGTEAGRNVLGNNVWVDAAMQKVHPGFRYVFTDVRFPNEVHAIAKAGGWLWRVERAGTKPVNAHTSETAVDGVLADALILNNGTLEDLHNAVRTLAKEFGWA